MAIRLEDTILIPNDGRKVLAEVNATFNALLPQVHIDQPQNRPDQLVDIDGTFLLRILSEHGTDARDHVACVMSRGHNLIQCVPRLAQIGFSPESQRKAALALVTMAVRGWLTSWVMVADSSPAFAILFSWVSSGMVSRVAFSARRWVLTFV